MLRINKKIAVIIVGFNNLNYLEDCLTSLLNSSYNNKTIIYVDNNSSDGSVGYVNNNYPEVLIIKNIANYGFAKGNNIGINKAINEGCQYIMLLNPDTVIEKKCIKYLLEKANNKTILQPLILLHTDGTATDLINTSGNILHYIGISYVGNYKMNYKKIKLTEDIAVASGAALLIPVNILKNIGQFDESFFMYHEDVDLSWRARIAGYKIKLVTDAKVWHKYSFTKNKNKTYFSERNRSQFILKNYSSKLIILISPILIFGELLSFTLAIKNRVFIYKIKSYVYILFSMFRLFKLRRIIQKSRKTQDSQLLKYFTPVIDFNEAKLPLMKPINNVFNRYWNIVLRMY